FSFGPRHVRHVAGVLLVTFQIFLIISGNLSFLNYLTIVPCLAAFDDTFWRRILPNTFVRRRDAASRDAALTSLGRKNGKRRFYRFWPGGERIQFAISVIVTVLVAFLSIAPVTNLVSNAQMMNASFDPLDLVNTYGAFGAVGKERFEIVFEGTDDAAITGD